MNRYAIIVLMVILLIFAAGCQETRTDGAVVPYKEITPDELLSWIGEGRDLLLVDVREDYEYNEGHIPGSILIPLGELMENHERLDREKEIVLICRSGQRSGVAAQFLAEEGYTEAYNMVGGMLAWRGSVKRVSTPYG